jgi:hypothetical protein
MNLHFPPSGIIQFGIFIELLVVIDVLADIKRILNKKD